MEDVSRDDGLDREPGSLALEARRLVTLLLIHLAPVAERVEGDHLRRDDRDVEQHQTLNHRVDHEHQVHGADYTARLDDNLEAVPVPVHEPAFMRGGHRVLRVVPHGRPHVLVAKLEDAHRLARFAVFIPFETRRLVVVVVLQLSGDLHTLEPELGVVRVTERVVHVVQVRAQEFEHLVHGNRQRLAGYELVQVVRAALHSHEGPRQKPFAVQRHVLVLHVERHVLRRGDEHVPRVAAVAPP